MAARQRFFAAVMGLVLTAGAAMAAETLIVPADGRASLALTIYGDGLAFIRDTREMALPSGASFLAFGGVSRNIIAGSAWLETNLGARVVALTSDLEPLSQESLLRRAVGQPVLLLRTHPQTGEETAETVTLLAFDGTALIRRRDRIETVAAQRLAVSALPAGLAAPSPLTAAVEVTSPGRQTLTLSYLSGGLTWSPDYLLTVDERTGRIGLVCRASLTNTSGATLERASVGLIAGQVRRQPPPTPPQPRGRIEAMASPTADAALPDREAVADLHLYRLAEPLTLEDQQTRQLTLFEVPELPVTRTYVSEGGGGLQPLRGIEPQPTHPRVRFTFSAPSAQGAQPLPAGIGRVFVRDGRGVLRFIGEDLVPATPAGGRVDLEPSEAFDVTVVRRQTDFVTGREPNAFSEAAWQIAVTNAKEEPVDVRLIERLPGDWKVLSQTAPFEKIAADRIGWTLTVPARGKAEVAYRVRTQR
jgi:hypothetical protein